MICHADKYIYFVGFVCVFCGLIVGAVCGLLSGVKLTGWAIKNRRRDKVKIKLSADASGFISSLEKIRQQAVTSLRVMENKHEDDLR